MAGGQERALRGRIQSMQSTKKITRAMELIAASRIVKAQQRVKAATPYSELITEVVKDLAAVGADSTSPLLVGRSPVKVSGYVAIAADRGLCGGYNAGVQRATEGEIKAAVAAGREYEIITVGRKVDTYFRFREYQIGKTFQGFSDNPTYADAKAIASHVIELYASGHVDQVELVYTRFVTPGRQEVVRRPLVPLTPETVAGGDGRPAANGAAQSYEFEPDPTAILDNLLPRYVEARVYAALLNAAASEHAFRQRAMKSATDNAEELIKNLSIVMNRARQDSITTEIMEIVGGAEALGADDDRDEKYVEIDLDLPPIDTTAPIADSGSTEADDLTLIKGVGAVLNARLHELGIFTYKEITTWDDAEMDRIDDHLSFEGRIQRDDWQGQARRLHNDKYPDDQI
ncbi:MAG: F0F1 ATP synthase subunit gamma [Ilumatobacter coccineus]|uniref:ATP synthase gamma chain n=1 Tax=Ilumatobacter coccineus TaxID=467094 RepID=A0A2G6KIR1_9ACTN|nr:MAG: F0F1 ATP synthase subunit gamma [Ilumatobacter coccineus]